jgi:hypothetical protein
VLHGLGQFRPAVSTERRDSFLGVLGDDVSTPGGFDVGSALAQLVADRAPPILRALGGVDDAGRVEISVDRAAA